MSVFGISIDWLVLAAGLLLALGFGGYRLWRWAPWRGARTRYPIVLAHGMMGFDEIGIGPIKGEYFRGVAAHLESLGNTVLRPRVPPLASVAERAERLASAIRDAPGRRVNVIAHSMGGLDARYAISKLGLGRRVASLTTIGTPHLGTAVADVGTLGMGALLAKLGFAAFGDLTSASMARFNQEVKNARGVFYACVLARQDIARLNPLLLPAHELLLRDRGDNDGLVSETSQKWGKVLLQINSDHWGQIGWSRHFDAIGFFEKLARKLRARGF